MNKEFFERINLTFDLNIISSKICELYKLGDYISEQLIEVGYEDFNYILETTTGKYCVKVYNKERTDEDVNKYIDRIELASKLDLNTPKVFKSNGSCLQTFNINNTKFRLTVFEYINGKSFYDLNEIPTQEEIKEIIHQMSVIHSATLNSDPIYDKWTITNFVKEYEEKKHTTPDKYKQIFERLLTRMKEVDFSKLTYSFVHGDIISSNVLKDEKGKLYIIDFAVSNYLPRIVDLAVTSCNLCLNPNDKTKTIYSTKMILDEYQKYCTLTEYELEVFPLFYDLANAMGILQISYLNSCGENSEEDNFWLEESEKGLGFSDDQFWNEILNMDNKSLKKI
ncbi:MAG: phosphotransferase [Bacilli bacterium]|nr:phosphotransferase [Bacilli bacterium]